jgi:hypothetical protein
VAILNFILKSRINLLAENKKFGPIRLATGDLLTGQPRGT